MWVCLENVSYFQTQREEKKKNNTCQMKQVSFNIEIKH